MKIRVKVVKKALRVIVLVKRMNT